MSYKLQFLHASDLEGGLEALDNATNFSRLVDHHIENFAGGAEFSLASDGSMREIDGLQ